MIRLLLALPIILVAIVAMTVKILLYITNTDGVLLYYGEMHMTRCRDCTNNVEYDKSMCRDCLNKTSARMRKLRLTAINNGICGKCRVTAVDPGKKRCKKCIDRERAVDINRRREYLSTGKCEKCGHSKSGIIIWYHNWCAYCQLKYKFNYHTTRAEADKTINDLLIKQNYKCALTGRSLYDNKYHIDHIIPRSASGEDMPSNWQLLVEEANVFKTNISMDDVIKLARDIVNNFSNVASIMDNKTMVNNNSNQHISNKVDCPDKEIIIYNGTLLTAKYIATLSAEERAVIADELFLYFSKKDFSKPTIDIKNVSNDMMRLKTNNVEIENNIIKNIASTGNHIYKYFFPNILKTYNSQNKSVAQILSDHNNLKLIINNRLGIGYKETFNITTNMIRQGAKSTGFAFHGSQFKPLVAKAIYNKYVKENDNVLDYSCGFGSRLLGLMALGKNNKYFGYEPNTETYKNLLTMSKHFNFNVDIKCCGSEDEIFDEKMNFVFSSPPYFNTEIYCEEPTQCYNKFPAYSDWLEKYWRQTVVNIKKMMADDAVFGVNIGNNANENMIRMAKDLNAIIVEEGFSLVNTLEMHTPISHLANKKNKTIKIKQEYIYFYKLNT